MAKVRNSLQLDENEQRQVLEWAVEGVSLVDISARLKVHPMDFVLYRKAYPAFAEEFNSMRQSHADILAESLPGMAGDESVHPGVTRNKLDIGKWQASKLNPRVYADRIDLNVTQSIDIGSILDAAAARITAPRDVTPELEAARIPELDEFL